MAIVSAGLQDQQIVRVERIRWFVAHQNTKDINFQWQNGFRLCFRQRSMNL
jgi:hypothetical protein